MKNESDFKKIKKQKWYQKPLIVISTCIIPILILGFIFSEFIYDQFKQQLYDSVELEAVRIGRHFSGERFHLQSDNISRPLQSDLVDQLKKIENNFHLWKIKMFDSKGIVIYSSHEEDLGNLNTKDYFINEVKNGEVCTKVVTKQGETLEGEKPLLDIVETYVPIMQDNKFQGAFEIYYDITDRVALLKIKKNQINKLMMIIGFYLSVILIILFIHESKVEIDRLNAFGMYEDMAKNWQNTFDAIEDIIFIVDENSKVLMANKKARTVCGGDISNKDYSCKLIHNNLECIKGCILKKCIETGDPVQDLIYEPHLGKKYFEVSAFPIRNQKGEIEKFVHAFKDVTAEKELENKVIHMQKIESIGKLAGGISHDFRNMVTVINGNIELLELQNMTKKQERFINEIKAATQSANDLTSKLLTFSRKEISKPQRLDLHQVIANAVSLFAKKDKAKIKLSQSFDSEKCVINGDLSAIQNMIVNLGFNAIDAMPKGGNLNIKTELTDLIESVCERIPFECKPGEYILITFSDEGEGIPESIMNNVFEPFFTTKSADKGTGLGLSVVHGTVVSHKGIIEIESEVDKGTTFKIYFPLAED